MEEIERRNLFIRIHAETDPQDALKKAVEVIQSGGVVAYPTESFYGLAVNPFDEDAVRRLFALKKRRDNNPVLLLLPSADVLAQYVTEISETARALIRRFWPGGLTLVFKASARISSLLTGRTGKIGTRLSGHSPATALARAFGAPITGTSANISGQPACVTAEEVFHSLGEGVDLILDGGRTKGPPGSTVLDVTVAAPRLVREGIIGYEQLKDFLRPTE